MSSSGESTTTKPSSAAENNSTKKNGSTKDDDINIKLNNRLTILATKQIGGKGTIRRRKLRKSASLTASGETARADQLKSFQRQFDVNNICTMDKLTLI